MESEELCGECIERHGDIHDTDIVERVPGLRRIRRRRTEANAGCDEPERDAAAKNKEVQMCGRLPIRSIDEDPQPEGDDSHKQHGNGVEVQRIGRGLNHGESRGRLPCVVAVVWRALSCMMEVPVMVACLF